ncbi:MAG: hypothetical protein ACXVZM_13555 [Terriglobales bacterium]
MASKSHRSGPDFSGIVEQWRKERNKAQRRKPDPLMERIRARRERIRKRVGLLDDSVDLIREDRDR